MLQFGLHITKPGDGLQKISIDRLFKGISEPKVVLRDKIEQLRIIKEVDPKQYRQLKKYLPYFVCGIFHPAIRRQEHFARIEYFMLDLDHLAGANIDKDQLLEKAKKLPEVVMAFTSPSGDGVKIMLRLDSPCSDAAMFSSFYKIYALRFGQLHGLSEVIDYRTSDVTRACFFSYDSEAWFNPSAKRIAMADYLRDMNFDAAEKDIKEAEKLIAEQQMVSPPKEKTELDSDILQKIKSKLNPNTRLQKRKQYTHSPEVEQAIPMLKEALLGYDIELVETHKINYGKKLKVHANKLWAELNVFYGKKGFTIVPTTKTGSHEELAKLAAQATKEILASYNTKNQ